MRAATIFALVPAVLATSNVPVDHPWDALKNVPYFPLESVLPVLSSRAVLDPLALDSRAILEESGRNQLAITPHRPHKRDTLSANNHGLAKRAKGQGKRGQIRSVVRRGPTCPTDGASSTTTASPTTKTGTTTKGGSTPTTKPTTSKTTTTAKPTSTKGITADKGGNGPFTGWGTWYDVGLGACGWWNNPGDPIVAVSQQLFDNWPGYNGLNPNVNPICGLHLAITWGGKTVIAEVADYCPGCAERSLDMSKGLFEQFADLDVGLLGGDNYTPPITWKWVEGTGSLPSLPVS